MKVVNSVLELIGNTPLMRLNRVTDDCGASILAKLEFLNPTGSIKDRIALSMIEAAEKEGIIKPGSTIIEATSGNTGIGLSFVAAAKGYKMIVVMPEVMSMERRMVMKIYGADLVLTPAKDFVEGSCKKAKELAKQTDGFCPDQFANPANVAAHRIRTGQEIWDQTDGKVDGFVAGVGTGGTLIGVAETLKKKNPRVVIAAVEPAESPVMSGGKSGSHRIEGIGDGFIPDIIARARDLVDEVITIKDEDAIRMTHRLIREEGLFVGISSGANVLAAMQLGKKLGKGKTVVTVLPDNAYRYFSTDLFKDI
jgi:cysteine synthase A